MRYPRLFITLVPGAYSDKKADRYGVGMRHCRGDHSQSVIQYRFLMQSFTFLVLLVHILNAISIPGQFKTF